MIYPELVPTPIVETVFSLTYSSELTPVDLVSFTELPEINNRFKDIQAIKERVFDFSQNKKGLKSNSIIGYDLRSSETNEVLRLRDSQLSYHFLRNYRKFPDILKDFSYYWSLLMKQSNLDYEIVDCSVRYINLIKIDADDIASRLVQLYPKYSSDKKIMSFQNAVKFTYEGTEDCEINAVTSKFREDDIIVDITVTNNNPKNANGKQKNLEQMLEPLQELKNKAFFDSITTRTLIKHLKL